MRIFIFKKKNSKIIHMLRNPLTQVNSDIYFASGPSLKIFVEMNLQILLEEIIYHLNKQIFTKDKKVKIIKMEHLLLNTQKF